MYDYEKLDAIKAPDNNINLKEWKIMLKAVAMYVISDYKLKIAEKAGVNLEEFVEDQFLFFEEVVLDCLDMEKTNVDGYSSYEINGQFWQDEVVSDWFVEISKNYGAMMDSGEYESVEAIEACAKELYKLLREGIVTAE